MTVETNIETIDIEGKGEKVLTDYQIHTISIVGQGALGINLTKVKSKDVNAFLETEGGAKLMSKIEKAKALDNQEVAQGEVAEEVLTEETVEEAVEAPVEQSEEVAEEVEAVEPEAEEVPVEDDSEAPEADAEEAEAIEPEAEPEVEEVEVAEEAEEVEVKEKAFTVSEMIQAQKDALQAIGSLVEKLQKDLPDADLWQITDLVYSAVYKAEDAVWQAQDSLWDDIYTEVYNETKERVHKAKALKVQESGDLSDKLKALEALDPALAELVNTQLVESKAKALKAEEDRKAVVRAKALASGAELYKRIATEDNTTDMITDAMLAIEESAPEQHAVLAKALETASTITMAGQLFPDVGSSESLKVQTEEEYVDEKAKSLVEQEGGNVAAARATVRGTEEYRTLFS